MSEFSFSKPQNLVRYFVYAALSILILFDIFIIAKEDPTMAFGIAAILIILSVFQHYLLQ